MTINPIAKRITRVITVFSFLLLMRLSCDPEGPNCHRHATFINSSTKAVYVLQCLRGFPDTVAFKKLPNPVKNAYQSKVQAGETSTDIIYRNTCFEDGGFVGVMVYVFDANTLETNGWENVKANNLYLRRYDLSLTALQARDWTIVFP